MAERCALCSKVLNEAYRVRDRFGKPTQLGTVIVNLLDEACAKTSLAPSAESADTICYAWRSWRRSTKRLRASWRPSYERTELLSSYKVGKCFVYGFPYPRSVRSRRNLVLGELLELPALGLSSHEHVQTPGDCDQYPLKSSKVLSLLQKPTAYTGPSSQYT